MKIFISKRFSFLIFLYLIKVSLVFAKSNLDQPNIVWIVSEDNSAQYLRLYSPNGVAMPAVEQLAAEGLVFENVFSNAPVCSVARSTLVTAAYAPRMGAQFHRAIKKMPMPHDLKMFPAYLRSAGYYCSNNSKEDYNLIRTPGTWDESSETASWKNRTLGQPFFHVHNFHTTHESRLHFNLKKFRATEGTLPATPVQALNPYLPMTPLGQFTHDWYLERHRFLDLEIAALLQQLKDDDLYENTIIFYFSDHGGALPRSKGYLYESGLQVPLVIRAPKKWAHLFPAKAGSRIEGFVNFVDFGPTMLALAGIEFPDSMDGQPFLGTEVSLKEINRRDEAFAYADRFDEKYDMVRSLRKGSMKYIRSYQPFNPDMTYNKYREKTLLVQEWRQLHQNHKLNVKSTQFFKARDPEALYNLRKDPHELNNLAGDPAYAEILKDLRESLRQKVRNLPDLSFYPESFLIEEASLDPQSFADKHFEEIGKLQTIADLSLQPFDLIRKQLADALDSDNPWERYWALITCTTFGKEAEPLSEKIRQISRRDSENLVRMRAAEYMGLTGTSEPVATLVSCLKAASRLTEALLVLNSMTVLQESPFAYRFPVNSTFVQKSVLKLNSTMLKNRLIYLSNSFDDSIIPID